MESTEPEVKGKDKRFSKKGCLGCLGIGVGVVAILAFIGSLIPEPTPEEIAARNAERAAAERQREIEHGHEDRLEAHRLARETCVNEWTGAIFDLGYEIRERLNDPDSYENDSTRIVDLPALLRAREIRQDDSMPAKAKTQAAGELMALPQPPADYTGRREVLRPDRVPCEEQVRRRRSRVCTSNVERGLRGPHAH